jgi:Fe-S-cluster-containing dehydrogenase component
MSIFAGSSNKLDKLNKRLTTFISTFDMVKKNTTEPKYWKSLDELSANASISQDYHQYSSTAPTSAGGEFAPDTESSTTVNRRGFIGILSASMALAATSCRRPDHKIVPTVKAVEYVTPGLPLHYTTVFTHGNAAYGLIVKSREGRPVKIEGNPKHTASGGSSSSWIQGSLLALYDPDRMKHPYINKGATSPDGRRPAPGYSSPETVLTAIADAMKKSEASGKVVRILMGEHASPSFAALVADVEAAFPSVKFVVVPAVRATNVVVANKAAFGVDAEFVIDYAKANVILSVDSDFMSGADKNAVFNIRQFAANRKPSMENPTMNELVVVEAKMSLTGTNADERIKAAPEQMTAFLASVLKSVSAASGAKASSIAGSADDSTLTPELKEKAKHVAADLAAASGKAVVTVGTHLPVAAHVYANALNYALGAFGEGKAIQYELPYSADTTASLNLLRDDLKAGKVGAIVFADVNPMYSGDAELKELLKKVESRFSLSMYEDETSMACNAYIPTAHFLESWSDALAFDGTLSLQQPLVAPLNPNSHSLPDLVVRLAQTLKPEFMVETKSYLDFVRARWANTNWDEVLRLGVFKGITPVLGVTALNEAQSIQAIQQSAKIERKGEYLVVVTPSHTHYDGSLSNVSWFQELPDPVSKLTWDNAAYVSKNTAAKILGEDRAKDLITEYEKTELIRIKTQNGVLELPLWIQPGMQDGVIATTLGFGRTHAGQVADNVGGNAYTLMGAAQSVGYVAAEIEKTDKPYKLATTQKHYDLMGRKIIQETVLGKMKKGEKELFEREPMPGRSKENYKSLPPTIMQNFEYKGHRWGMVIDLSGCVGCGACITACQAENNIPVVGKSNVANAREMHWIRIDRYYKGDIDNPETVYQPMLCQHCENAPCENVCPVAATTHSPEGLNEMTYNRCVGTKYCANNCPYKVRRFNWLNFHKNKRTPMEFVYNPEVTVRMRGVMEKCSFCVQRLTEAKHTAKDAGRLFVNDGDVVTACQQACPASAIYFGNTNDPESAISKARDTERTFIVLEELNVRPQVTYLAKVRNVAEKAEEKA